MTEAIATEGGENELGPPECMLHDDGRSAPAAAGTSMCRKEKRKALKKVKRKQRRKELAEKVRLEEEARINDPEEQRRIRAEEEREKERIEIGRREFEERERLFLEALAARKKAEEEEEERRQAREEEEEAKLNQAGHRKEFNENNDDDWEYVEEGPPEIIWQGNEIIVRKKKVKVKKKDIGERIEKEDPDRPTSNPLPPQSEAFADYRNASSMSAQQLLENVAQQIPNFGTEQDKAHCPFHLKTGACRFGLRCSRVHFYPDKSCTLLIKNMYNGPGLAWELDEGLEHTDEEIECCYEDFYEDVHTEFLKFGEIINFKVCRNGAYHLRGNVYVHYKSLDSALLAYHSINGRYFAGRQVKSEFVGVTRWKVAICGEYMKSRLKTCSRGTACNFIHCFRNPGGDYEWADWDKPPPKYWVKNMIALFGYSDDTGYDKQMELENSEVFGYQSRRSQLRERHVKDRSSRGQHGQHDDTRRITEQKQVNDRTKRLKIVDQNNYEEEANLRDDELDENRSHDGNDESAEDWQLYGDRDEHTIRVIRKSSRNQINISEFRNPRQHSKDRSEETYSDENFSDNNWDGRFNDCKKSSKHRQKVVESVKDFVGSKNSTRADSRRSRLHYGKYRDRHSAERNKSSKHQRRESVSPDDHSNCRSGSRNYDDSVDWSDEDRGRQQQTSPRHSSKRFSYSRETSEADARCDSEADMDRGFRSEHAGKRNRPRRNLSGDDHRESESPDAYDGRSKYHSRLHADVRIDDRGRWEPEGVPDEHLYV